MKKINVGLIGFGTVGSGVVQVLTTRRAALGESTGVDIKLKYICDKDITSSRGFRVDKKLLTKDVKRVLEDTEVDILIELIGGIHPAKEIILSGLRDGKDIVTANKALLAEVGEEILAEAKGLNRQLRFEAAVGGGIPIIKALREGLVANRLNEVYGIVNGTCNYILSRMSKEGCPFNEALKAAKEIGVAEANPALDVSGADSTHKLVILSALGFGRWPRLNEIFCEGILDIKPRDIQYAKEMGYVIKLLAIAKRSGDKVEARVHPTLIREGHLLADVSGVYNAIYVKGDLIGEALFYGEGAGKFPTASAVISDVVDLARSNRAGRPAGKAGSTPVNRDLRIKRISEVESRYYLRFTALDRPGVLARIAGILGRNDISIASVSQKEVHSQRAVPIVIMTHSAVESNLRKALKSIDLLPVIKKKSVAIRMESL